MSNRILLCLGLLLLASCNNKVTKSHTAKSMEIYGPGVLHIPVVADLEVRPAKVSFTVDDKRKSLTMRQLKESAIAGTLQEQKADVLVEPSFSLERKRGVNTLTVTGWPADYKRFRNLDTNDIRLVETGTLHRAQTSTPNPEVEHPRKRVGGIIAIALAGIVVLLTLTLPIY